MRAVVVGGGASGLASAALLAREGYQVTLLEARAEVGGRASVWAADGFRFDIGPSWYLMPEVFEHFFALMGTSAADELDLVSLDPAYRAFFERYEPLDVHSDVEASAALFESIEPGAGDRIRGYLDSASEAYHMALRHFLYTTYASVLPLANREVLRRAPRLARLLTRSLESRIHATVRDTRLRQILGYPAVFLGASPRLTPSMYHLMSHLDLADGVLYPQGGFGQVIEALRRVAERAGVDIRTGCRVTSITTAAAHGSARPLRLARGQRARVTGVAVTGPEGPDQLDADLVVAATDLEETEQRLLPAALRTYSPRWWRRQVPGPSAVMVYLGVRGALPQLAHHSLFLAHEWDATFDLIFDRRARRPAPMPDPTSVYVSRTSATDSGAAPDGHENLVILVPVPADVELGGGGVDRAGDPWVEAVADEAIAQVADWAHVPDLAERIVVRRTVGPADWARDLRAWRGTALGPAHTLRQSAMFRAGNASRRVAGLLYAGGSVIPGIGVPMCLISAELVIKRLRGDTSTGPLPEPAPTRAVSDRTAGS
ncbi:phytoene desaturase family protein [Isoptericola sp. b441]|uniref:Phytoene desaturase family protein n=1 Tax=Actinotalea lenta TaxID=3064654 RepID=A0ABT9DAH5_9CELL|nr:phytoene desaturase family protein [Isoptericola sp. b441]MDO8106301.1 phytoene desaturase family protein [Isoptericola sp. b441]